LLIGFLHTVAYVGSLCQQMTLMALFGNSHQEVDIIFFAGALFICDCTAPVYWLVLICSTLNWSFTLLQFFLFNYKLLKHEGVFSDRARVFNYIVEDLFNYQLGWNCEIAGFISRRQHDRLRYDLDGLNYRFLPLHVVSGLLFVRDHEILRFQLLIFVFFLFHDASKRDLFR
jgi:hypothetical protein